MWCKYSSHHHTTGGQGGGSRQTQADHHIERARGHLMREERGVQRQERQKMRDIGISQEQ